jgi:hypothetical protein
MNDWKSLLKSDPTDWLLEPSNPSVRYFMLRDILEKPETDHDVKTAKKDIMDTGVVPIILSKQQKEGNWGAPERFYVEKYKGTVWQLLILAELGADGTNPSVKKACEFILTYSQDKQSGGFAHSPSAKQGGGRHSEVIPCLTGNMVYSFLRFGYLNDPRIQQSINWITSYQRFDDGTQEQLTGWPYDRLKSGCFSKHTCHMGAIKALKALAEIPPQKRSPAVKKTLDKAVEYILLHHVYKKSHDLNSVAKPGWLKLGFPLMYQNDILEILGILTSLGIHDPRMQDAVDILVSKQDNKGRWTLESTFNGRFHTTIEQKGKPSKWITFQALKTLKQFYQ